MARKPLLEKLHNPVQEQRQKAAHQARQREYVTAIKETAFREFLDATIRSAAEPLPPQPAPPKKPKAAGQHLRYPLLTLNDWHFEEVVKASGVMGLNSYDIPTACRRVFRVTQACRAWKADQEAGKRFAMPELSIALLGDMLTGTLHKLERHSDAPNVVRAAIACGQIIALAINDLAADFDSVKVVGVVGNHGRLPDDPKVPTKDPTRSWDYLAYRWAQNTLRHNPRISWEFPEAYGVLFSVGPHLCYACHGNFIPNNLGVVGYGVRRFTSSLASNLQAAGKPLRYCFFGHWHSSHASEFAGVEAFISPSLIGTQEYGFLSGGSVNRSAQSLFLFDKKLGLLSQERLYGEGGGYPGTYEVSL